jgi:hypothetical protein
MRAAAVFASLAVLMLRAPAAPASAPAAQQAAAASIVADRMQLLTRDTVWKLERTIPLAFDAHHPQGMARIGDTLIVSSVEVKVRTMRYPAPVNGLDRDAGEGAGHLFKIDMQGQLLADLRLGEGTIYHPGGIDFDGTNLWVPVAEYRPNSRSILYRVDPRSFTATPILRFADHIGAIVHDTDGGALHGVSWGSRRFYTWTLNQSGDVANAGAAPESLRTPNPSHYVDYQDCKYAGRRRMLCTGVAELRAAAGAAAFRLGGADLIDVRDYRPRYQSPVLLWTPAGLDLTHNAVWLEPTATGIRGFFLPEDGRAAVYVYMTENKN